MLTHVEFPHYIESVAYNINISDRDQSTLSQFPIIVGVVGSEMERFHTRRLSFYSPSKIVFA